MLEKGFLRPPEKEETTRAVKKSRLFFFVGVLLILLGFFMLMARMQQGGEQISIVWLASLFVGFLLISVSLWMNFFAQKNRRR